MTAGDDTAPPAGTVSLDDLTPSRRQRIVAAALHRQQMQQVRREVEMGIPTSLHEDVQPPWRCLGCLVAADVALRAAAAVDTALPGPAAGPRAGDTAADDALAPDGEPYDDEQPRTWEELAAEFDGLAEGTDAEMRRRQGANERQDLYGLLARACGERNAAARIRYLLPRLTSAATSPRAGDAAPDGGQCRYCPNDVDRGEDGYLHCIECGWTDNPATVVHFRDEVDELRDSVDALRAAGNGVAAAFSTAIQMDYGGNEAATSASRLVCREIRAWRSAAGEAAGADEPRHEVQCPRCGITVRARMADAPTGTYPPAIDESDMERARRIAARAEELPGVETVTVDLIEALYEEVMRLRPSAAAMRAAGDELARIAKRSSNKYRDRANWNDAALAVDAWETVR